jgi:hypothetical protein
MYKTPFLAVVELLPLFRVCSCLSVKKTDLHERATFVSKPVLASTIFSQLNFLEYHHYLQFVKLFLIFFKGSITFVLYYQLDRIHLSCIRLSVRITGSSLNGG